MTRTTTCDYWKPIPDGGIALPCSCGHYCDFPPSIADDDEDDPKTRDPWDAPRVAKPEETV